MTMGGGVALRSMQFSTLCTRMNATIIKHHTVHSVHVYCTVPCNKYKKGGMKIKNGPAYTGTLGP